MSVVSCSHLCKTFTDANGTTRALDDISFELPHGGITGLLGPDGAGKTTLLRLITCLLKPTAGTVAVWGLDTIKHAAEIQSRVAYMPQKFGLYENLSILENLYLYAELHAVDKALQSSRFDQLLQMTGLSRFGDRYAGKLSGGMKQKLALACALVAEPELMVLDEPTVGVDILSRRELWAILRQIVNTRQMTVLVSTAYMDEADYCDRTLTLFAGRLLADLTPAQVRAKAAGFSPEPTFEEGFQVLLSGRVAPPLIRLHPPAPQAPVLLRADNIVKKFGDFVAVNHISFAVRRGEIFGLLGANGAGKTTTFRMLCGLSEIDGGAVEVAGYNLRHAGGAARAKIGYMAQKFSLYCDISVLDNLRFFGGAYGLAGKRRRERIEWALDAFDLQNYRHSNTGKLPLGCKQRLSMACALLHEPEILFLDEATSGADPMTRREFWKRITELADAGVAVIITTHFLDEAKYCDTMIIMQDGMSAAAGTADEIRQIGHSADMEEAFVNIIAEFRRQQSKGAKA